MGEAGVRAAGDQRLVEAEETCIAAFAGCWRGEYMAGSPWPYDWCDALNAIGGITEKRLWPQALSAVRGHPRHRMIGKAGVWFWITSAMRLPRENKPDIARAILPRYAGADGATLYRGQPETEPFGLSWTDSIDDARRFARNKDDSPGVVYSAHAPAEAIICHVAQFVMRRLEREFAVDPALLIDIQKVETVTSRRGRRPGKSVQHNSQALEKYLKGKLASHR